MSKISKDLITQTQTALAAIPEANGVREGLIKPLDMNLLPTLKLVFPIEVSGTKECIFGTEHIRKMVISDGKSASLLKAPYTLLTVAIRNAARVEVRDGKEITYDRAFDKIFFGGNTYQNSLKEFEIMQEAGKEQGVQMGLSSVVAIITTEGVVIAEFPLFKTVHGYWYNPVVQSLLDGGAKIQIGHKINITDHSENFVTSQNGFAYPSKSKFRQLERIELPEEDIVAVFSALKENESKFISWLER